MKVEEIIRMLEKEMGKPLEEDIYFDENLDRYLESKDSDWLMGFKELTEQEIQKFEERKKNDTRYEVYAWIPTILACLILILLVWLFATEEVRFTLLGDLFRELLKTSFKDSEKLTEIASIISKWGTPLIIGAIIGKIIFWFQNDLIKLESFVAKKREEKFRNENPNYGKLLDIKEAAELILEDRLVINFKKIKERGKGKPAKKILEFNVVLYDSGDSPEEVIKRIEETYIITPDEAKNLVMNTPQIVGQRLPEEKANLLADFLTDAGAYVEIEPCNTGNGEPSSN